MNDGGNKLQKLNSFTSVRLWILTWLEENIKGEGTWKTLEPK